MAESQKGTSSIKSKEKTSLLDDEIGNEFLSSWKSMSVTEDDAMDFNFDTVPKGKKKAFNFEKMDMDFNLDGDFDKLSSFKVDMSDLDFSCSPKKTAKPKGRTGEERSSGNNKGKKDGFNFSFDFSDLDGFNLDSSLMKEDKKSNKASESKGIASERSQCQGSKLNLTEGNGSCDESSLMNEDKNSYKTSDSKGVALDLTEGNGRYDDSSSIKVPATKSAVTSKVETLIGGQGEFNSFNDDSASKSETFENLVLTHGGRTSPGKTIMMSAEETDQQICSSQKSMFTEPSSQLVKDDIPVKPVHDNESNQHTLLDFSKVQTQISSLGTKEKTASGGEQTDADKMIFSMGSHHEDSACKNSPPMHITASDNNDAERNKTGGNEPIRFMDDMEPAESAEQDVDMEDNTVTNISRQMPYDTKGVKKNESSTSNFSLAPLDRVVDTRTLVKGKEDGDIHSISCKRPEETGPKDHQPSGTKFPSIGSKRVGAMHLSPSSEKVEGLNANDAQTGSKLVHTTISVARELTKDRPLLLGSENNVKNLSKIREGINSDNVPIGSKLIENLRPQDKEVKKGEFVLLGSEKSVKDHHSLSLTGKTTECGARTSVNSKLVLSSMESMRHLKNVSAERNKLCCIKAGKRTPDLSSIKTSRITEANKVLSSSISRREINSLEKSEKKMKVQGNIALKTERCVDSTEKQMSQSPSLKRKTFEASNADSVYLKPLKRLSASPSESSNSKLPLESVLEEQVCIHGIQAESSAKHVFTDHRTSGLECAREVNMMDLEIPLVMENDGNVEKAEAYTKDLDDICNMLRKKHEEAKEILVRAIVNNNNLLMLNHPIYDEKIRKIQSFASQLMSKELQA
ncbi:uncharacterized protein At4g18490-like [Quercus robur]|uniref:uncharacterized protein At4g18490-like n=1 Tax=Quercus robur TaxID=38942 RepID=UPI0021632A12|nr:uncharacterized protein At4g18490-like [Quercus robur]